MSDASPRAAGSDGRHMLIKILEDAVEGGADAVELEYDSGGALEVCFMVGNSGAGQVLTDRRQSRALIAALVKAAQLERKRRGQMQLTLRGQEHTVFVEERDHFGDSAYRLRLKGRTRSERKQ